MEEGRKSILVRSDAVLIYFELILSVIFLSLSYLTSNIYFKGVGVGLIIALVTSAVAHLYRKKNTTQLKLILNHPKTAVKLLPFAIDNRLKISDRAKVSNRSERVFIENFEGARKSRDFSTMAHIQRYEFVLPKVKGLDCLDDGCGSGYGTNYLARRGARAVIGIDASADAINFDRRNYGLPNCKFRNMNSLELDSSWSNSFDVVISFDVLEHIAEKNQDRFISEIARVVKQNGKAYIGCPNAAVNPKPGENPFHLKELTASEFEILLRRHFGKVKMLGQDILVEGHRLGGATSTDTWTV